MYGNFTERELDAFWKGVESEQERIIKLLEEWPICDESCYCLPCNLGETEMIRKEFTNLLAEIKGKR